jgi:hypothetical protein
VRPAEQIARLKVTLEDISPPIWRELQLPMSFSFAQLSDVILAAFGWTDSHLHEFEVGERRIGMPDPDGSTMPVVPTPRSDPLFDQLDPELRAAFGPLPALQDEATVSLAQALTDGRQRFAYRYDFGDDWTHAVEVSEITDSDPALVYPRCSAGARACPPEDCGGLPGYKHLLAVLADPSHEEHGKVRAWYPLLAPEKFELVAADEAVRNSQSH